MMSTLVRFVKFHKDAQVPVYASAGAAGCDLYSLGKFLLEPRAVIFVNTGIGIEIPDGLEAQVRGRSGLAMIGVFCPHVGTIDSDYRGEIRVFLENKSNVSVHFNTGHRIAQLVFAPVVGATFVQTKELNETARGTGGFGSTGA